MSGLRSRLAWLLTAVVGSWGAGLTPLGAIDAELPAAVDFDWANVPDATPAVLVDQAIVHASTGSPAVELQLGGTVDRNADGGIASVVLVVHPDGATERVLANEEGRFPFQASEGLHAAYCLGASAHAAVPFVVRYEAELPSNAIGVPARLTLPTFALEFGRVKRASNSYLPPLSNRLAPPALDRTLLETGRIIPSRRYRVNLGPEGLLQGQLFPLMPADDFSRRVAGTTVLIHRDGELVARAATDATGWFEVQNLEPGTYGLIAAGNVGYTAFAFEAVERLDDSFASRGSSPATSRTLTSSGMANGSFSDRLIKAVADGDVLPVTPIPAAWVPEDLFGAADDDCQSCLDDVLGEDACELCGACGCDVGCGVAGNSPVAGGGGGGGGGGGFGGGFFFPPIPIPWTSSDDPIVPPATRVLPEVVE